MKESEKIKAVYRLTRTHYKSGRSLNCKISLTRLVRKSSGFDMLQDDCCMCGADVAWERITNLDECKDGIYELITINEKRDWETGYVDDYDFKLIPYMTEKDKYLVFIAEQKKKGLVDVQFFTTDAAKCKTEEEFYAELNRMESAKDEEDKEVLGKHSL